MSEMNEKGMLYDINDAVKALNRVEGFEPKNYLREEDTEEGKAFYLDTKYRLLWYRLKYPEGKLVKIPKALNKEYATFEVRVYTHKDDAPENFIANGFASRYKDDGNEKFGLNFVESAETAALGRALKDAGFGTQFCDIALPNDQTIVDVGVHISFDIGNAEMPNPDEDGVPAEEDKSEMVNDNTSEDTVPPSVQERKEETQKEEEEMIITADMSIEEMLNKMTVEYAKSVVVDYGYDRGKTLGSLAAGRPQAVQYHAERAKNNIVKAAATFLIENAKAV